MINSELRSKIDKLWTKFWEGGITNPLTVIEQISFLMFSRLLDIKETREERKAARTGKPIKRIYRENEQSLRWSNFKNLCADDMLKIVRDGVFPHFRNVTMNGSNFGEYMKDSQLMILKSSLLVEAVNIINDLPLTEGDTKGDLYEHLLSKLTTAGIAGQFRTPRHIIASMVELVDPKPNEIIGDPACGTGGFLVGAMHYLMKTHTSPEGIIHEDDGEITYSGDLLESYREHMQKEGLHGFDFDATMLRIAAMNLLLHGIEVPNIHYRDTLSNAFPEHFPKQSENYFDVVLANPPFKGSIDYDDVHPSLLKKVKTKKTELLFVILILKMLKNGGRCAIIVPDGVLFGSSKAHLALRQLLVDENQLEGVISLPSGVFKPYAGVSTAVLVFTKGGKTDNVFFYDVQADGFSLDDKRDEIDDNDLLDLPAIWNERRNSDLTDRTKRAFFVPLKDIQSNKYDLSLNRYKETVYEEEEFDPPRDILNSMIDMEKEINDLLINLKGEIDHD